MSSLQLFSLGSGRKRVEDMSDWTKWLTEGECFDWNSLFRWADRQHVPREQMEPALDGSRGALARALRSLAASRALVEEIKKKSIQNDGRFGKCRICGCVWNARNVSVLHEPSCPLVLKEEDMLERLEVK